MTQSVLSSVTLSTTDRAPDPIEYLTNIKRLRDEFFRGEWNYIVRPNCANSSWVTCKKFPLSVGAFVNKFADPLNLLGISFGDITNYLVQDIDIRSPYHPANDSQEFDRFLGTLDKIGLTAPVIIQSSYSGGIHIYYFLARSLSTIRVATLANVTLIDAGFRIKDGHLELFPNVKKYAPPGTEPTHFKGLRSPLQPNSGAMILDRDGNPLLSESDFSYETQLQKFLQLAIESAATNDIDLIEKKLDPAYKKYTKKIDKYQQLSGSKNFSPRALEWKENLETEFEIGWTGNGQTNDLLRKFVEYAIVFEQITDRDEICKRVLERVLITRGYHEHCRHQLTIEDRIADWVDSNLKTVYSVPYCAMPPRRGGEYPSGSTRPASGSGTGVNLHNIATADRAFQRFLDVLDFITDIPNRIGDLHKQIEQKMRELFGIAISNTTLYKAKYKAVWMKLIGSKKAIDLVPLSDDLGVGVCNNSETYTETELEMVNFHLEDNTLKSLEPIFDETSPTLSHYDRFITGSVGSGGELVDTKSDTESNLDPQLSNNNSSLPDLPPQSIEPETVNLSISTSQPEPDNLSTSPSQPEEAPVNQIPDSDTNTHPDSIGTPVEPYTSLIVRDRVQLIDSCDPAHSIGVLYRIVGSIATVVWKATKQPTDYLLSELRVVDLPNPTTDLDRHSESLKRRQRQSIEQNRLFPHINDRVRPVDPYHVHGAHIGIVTAIESWGVYVNWQDGSSGRYAISELVKIEPAPT
jgi:hypothetical protein